MSTPDCRVRRVEYSSSVISTMLWQRSFFRLKMELGKLWINPNCWATRLGWYPIIPKLSLVVLSLVENSLGVRKAFHISKTLVWYSALRAGNSLLNQYASWLRSAKGAIEGVKTCRLENTVKYSVKTSCVEHLVLVEVRITILVPSIRRFWISSVCLAGMSIFREDSNVTFNQSCRS